MDTQRICPNCHKPLAPEAPLGLCPECLVKAAFPTGAESGPAVRPAFAAPPAAQIAALFPELEILELIGQGGMGAVYKARQTQLDRIVALKILPPSIGQTPAFAERFTREARALARLNHPGIVTLYEFGQVPLAADSPLWTQNRAPAANKETQASPGLYYFLMEYVDGVTLRQLLRVGRVSPREALAIVPQVCDALQFAHDRGIVHRDIKPENILLDKQGRVKIADFGIARMVEEQTASSPEAGSPAEASASLTAAATLGTPKYMAPEQVKHASEADHRADIYSLGVVLYEMLTGELPAKRLEPPSRKVQIDVRLDEVVLRALEQKPELRYQQASDVKTIVETIASTAGSSPATTEAAPARARKICQEKSIGLGLGIVAAGLLAWCLPGVGLVLSLLGVGTGLYVALRRFCSKCQRRASETAAVCEGCGSEFEPGYSLAAIVGAWCAGLAFIVGPLCLWLTGKLWLPDLILLLEGLASIVATFLGWVAIHQIRHSDGKLKGMSLAVFDALLLPLFLSDLAIVKYHWPANRLDSSSRWTEAVASWAVVLLLDFLIIHSVWRKVNTSVRSAGGGAPAPAAAPARSAWAAFCFTLVCAGCMGAEVAGRWGNPPDTNLRLAVLHSAVFLGAVALTMLLSRGVKPWWQRLVLKVGALFSLFTLLPLLAFALLLAKGLLSHQEWPDFEPDGSFILILLGLGVVLLPVCAFKQWNSKPLEVLPAGARWRSRRYLGRALAAGVCLALVLLLIKCYVLEALVVSGSCLEPEVPAGSRILVSKLSKQCSSGDLLAYYRKSNVWIGRVVSVSPKEIFIAHNGATNHSISPQRVVGKVVSVYWRATPSPRIETVTAGPPQAPATAFQMRLATDLEDESCPSDLYTNIDRHSHIEIVRLLKPVLLDGAAVTHAGWLREKDDFQLLLHLNEEGRRRVAEITSTNVGRHIGLLVDGKLLSAPVVRGPISTGQMSVSLNCSLQAIARMLALFNERARLTKAVELGPERRVELPVSFGPQRVLLNVQSGLLYTNSHADDATRDFLDWRVQTGASVTATDGFEDATKLARDERFPVLLAYDWVIVPAEASAWNITTPLMLLTEATLADKAPRTRDFLELKPGVNSGIYYFRAGETFGILEVLGYSADRHAVEMRYKLVLRAEHQPQQDPDPPYPPQIQKDRLQGADDATTESSKRKRIQDTLLKLQVKRLGTAEAELKEAETQFQIGRLTSLQLEGARAKHDIANAELEGDRSGAAWTAVALAQLQLDATNHLFDVGKATRREVEQARLACATAAASPILAQAPPRLLALAWQEDWKTDHSGAARSPKGNRLTNALQNFFLESAAPVAVQVGTPKIQQCCLHLWFAHPLLSASAFCEVALLDSDGKPIEGSGAALASRFEEPNDKNGSVGWFLATLYAGELTNTSARLTVRLRFSPFGTQPVRTVEWKDVVLPTGR